jgi:chromosome segregation ATPase
MNKEQVSYSTSDMLKLINTAGKNLLLKNKKVTLEAQIRRQRQERDYKMDVLTAARKKFQDLAPELPKAEELTREARKTSASLQTEHEALKNELDKLLDLQRRQPMLQPMTVEIETLKEGIASMQKMHEAQSRSLIDIRKKAQNIEQIRNRKKSDLQASKEKLEAMNARHEQLNASLSDVSIATNLEGLLAEEESSGKELMAWLSSNEIAEIPLPLISFLQSAKKVYDIDRLIKQVSPQESGRIADLSKVNESGMLSGMFEEINRQVTEFSLFEKRRSEGLQERRDAVVARFDAARDKLDHLKADMDRMQAELTREHEFRERSHALIREHEDELRAQTVELERVKKEAERVVAVMESGKVFVEAIAPSIRYVEDINKKLGAVLENYKSAFYAVVVASRGRG